MRKSPLSKNELQDARRTWEDTGINRAGRRKARQKELVKEAKKAEKNAQA